MMNLRRMGLAAAVLAACASGVWAQAVEPVAMGNVTGTITCGDTQRPARFASVTLAPVKAAAPKPLTAAQKKAADDDPASAMKMLGALMSGITMLTSQTGLDGTYAVENVAPGDYYVSAVALGYISPVTQAMENAPKGAKGKAMFAGLPVVHVEANRQSRGDVTMVRGAAVSGVVTYDDGSPAAGVKVAVERAEAEAKKAAKDDDDDDPDPDAMAMMPLVMASAAAEAVGGMTDDRGRFRLAGVAAGEYRLKATVVANNAFSMRGGEVDMSSLGKTLPLEIYAPGVLHKKDGATFTVKAGDERADVQIRADLTGLHVVSGHVDSATDHHRLNAGKVTLVDTADKGFKRTAPVDATGSFKVQYVPAGSYTLSVSEGADTEAVKGKGQGAFGGLMRFGQTKTLRSYEEASQAVLVVAGDVTGVAVEMTESKTVKKDVDLNKLLGGGKE